MLVMIQSIILEVCVLISSYTAAGIAGDALSPKNVQGKERLEKRAKLAEHTFVDSCIILLEYVLKLLTAYHFNFPEHTIAYKVPLSPDPHRAVFPVRHLQWLLGVPLLVLLSNRAFLAGECTEVEVLLRSAPGVVLSAMYCACAYVMELTTSVIARNLLIALILASFVAVSADQVCLALSVPCASARRLKLAMLGYQLLSFGGYAIVYFTAYFGYMDHAVEQSLYTYMDATVKLLHGCFLAMLRNYEDMTRIKLWWGDAVSARRDFDHLVEEARVPIFVISVNGNVKSWNSSMEVLTGLSTESAKGMAISRVLTKDCVEAFQRALRRAATGGEASCSTVEIFVRRSPSSDGEGSGAGEGTGDGSKGPAVLVISVVRKLSREGAVEGYACIGQDITEVREMKAVEQKNVQLMAVVSHELRSPLHGIIGLAKTMEQSCGDGLLRSELGLVLRCADRLLEIVAHGMDEGLKKTVVDLGDKRLVNFLEVAEEVMVMTMVAKDKAGKPLANPDVRLENHLPDLEYFPVVLGHPAKCFQLLYNLVTNACKYTRRGSVTLRAVHRKESSVLEIRVEDTGSGIKPETLQNLFRPFEHDHRATADAGRFQGMGLGLAVCREICHIHGGSIHVSSKHGEGSTFIVTLPCEQHCLERSSAVSISRALLDELGRSPPSGRAAGSEGPPAPRESPRALVNDAEQGPSATIKEEKARDANAKPLVLSVDDDEINQEVVRNTLAGKCEIRVAMDGMEALDYLRSCKDLSNRLPDLILLDIQMPGLTGYEVLAEIRNKYSRKHIQVPVIMLSAKAPYEVVAVRCFSGGCSDYLAKPFHTDLLAAKVAVALKMQDEVRDEAKAKQAADETAQQAALRWEKRVKDNQAKIGQSKQHLEEVEARARGAEEQAAEAKERARSSIERAESMEGEVARLREELARSRALAEAAPPVGARPEDAPAAEAPPLVAAEAPPLVAGPQRSRQLTPRSLREQVPQRPAAEEARRAWHQEEDVSLLYEQLGRCEQEIMELRGRLAAHSTTRRLTMRQLEMCISAATCSQEILAR